MFKQFLPKLWMGIEGDEGGGGGGGGDEGGGEGGEGKGAVDFKASLPDDLKAHPALEKIKDVTGLVKSFISQQKFIGGEKLPVPKDENDTDAYNIIFDKLGRPKDENGYKTPEITYPDGFPKIQDVAITNFKKKALELGLLPRQAEGMFKWYMDSQVGEFKNFIKTRQETMAAVDATLRTEWGKAYEGNIAMARKVVSTFGSKELNDVLNDPKTNLGNNPHLVKFLVNLGSKLGEDVLDGKPTGLTMTPDEALAEIKKIQGDKKHPYFDKVHPEHQIAMQRMEDLHKMAYPETPAS